MNRTFLTLGFVPLLIAAIFLAAHAPGAPVASAETVESLVVDSPTTPTLFSGEVEVEFTWSESHVCGPYRAIVAIVGVASETFVYEPGVDIRPVGGPFPDCPLDQGIMFYTMTHVLEVPADTPTGCYDLVVTVEENWPPGSETWDFGQTRTLEAVVCIDVTPPEASCVETVNPHGQTVPRAGQRSPGQNEDGFYEIGGEDDSDNPVEVFVVDVGSGTVFGPYESGTLIKYTQAPGATPSASEMGSNNGQGAGNGNAGAIDVQIKGQGDLAVIAVDAAGNVSGRAACLVPPPPK